MTHRTRGWRRAQACKHPARKSKSPRRACREEKAWRLLYFRSAKLNRARQLGYFWPHREWEALMKDADPINVLFVCSMNKWRSPTGEKIFAKTPGLSVRSAGTVRGSKRTLSVNDMRWADVILVMEEKHKARIQARFRDEVRFKRLHVLDIPDEYCYMDPELVELLQAKAEPLIWDEA